MEMILLLCLLVLTAAVVYLFMLLQRRERLLHDANAERSTLQGRLEQMQQRVVSAEATTQQIRGQLEDQQQQLQSKIAELIKSEAQAQTKLQQAEQKLEEVGRQNEQQMAEQRRLQREEFANLATKIFADQSAQFKQSSGDSLEQLLKPFKENIAQFRERVEKIYSEDNEQRGALKNQLSSLVELNHRITAETTNLTNALKGSSKVQGDWGEMILETILDSSGLIKGVHYLTQMNVKSEEGANLRPDVVLNLPDNKHIVIDSKVSITAFVAYTEAQDEAERSVHRAAHLQSVRNHVKELSAKGYQESVLGSPDFVVMFIPNEAAFLAAMQGDSSIWNFAYKSKVIISSPTNLFAILKLVKDMWRRDDQDRNTAEIVKRSTILYEKLVAFSKQIEGVGKGLDSAKTAYDSAYKYLHTGNDNIIRTGERLRALGLPVKSTANHSATLLEGNESELEVVAEIESE